MNQTSTTTEFVISISGPEENAFSVTASSKRTGKIAKGSFKPLLKEESLFNFAARMAGNRSVTRGRFYTDDEHKMAQEIGITLFTELINEHIDALFRAELEWADALQGHVQLVLDLSKAKSLLSYPWELLYDQKEGTYLIQRAEITLIRMIDEGKQITPKQTELPLKILLVGSKPPGVASLQIDEEVAEIRNMLESMSSRFSVYTHTNPTLPQLIDVLDDTKPGFYDVLHFIGHGQFDERTGENVLLFANANNEIDYVNAERFTAAVRNRGFQLAVLNTCEAGRIKQSNPFSSISLSLLRSKIAAVVAMQFQITDNAAVDFSRGLYKELSENKPIDAAVSNARGRISAAQNTLEWATPVLYLRAASTQLFDLREVTRGPSTTERRKTTNSEFRHTPSGNAREKNQDKQTRPGEPQRADVLSDDPFEKFFRMFTYFNFQQNKKRAILTSVFWGVFLLLFQANVIVVAFILFIIWLCRKLYLAS